MSYNIGQLRRDQIKINDYSTSLSYLQELIKNESTDFGFVFYDQCIRPSNALSSLYSYYLKFEVKQISEGYTTQDFILKLQSDETSIESVQEIKSFTVKKGTGTIIFELIFNPNSTYNQIVFQLSRTADDFYQNNKDGTSGRVMDIKILEFTQIANIIPQYLAKKYQGLKTLKKIGIQGPPGLLFCIDGEEIRIGRSGIYELYNDNIEISYIGFIIRDSLFTQDGKDFFIMDFKY